MRSFSAKFEWIAIWVVTICVSVLAVNVFQKHDFKGLLFLALGYFGVLVILNLIFRLSLPFVQRGRDVFPWDRSIFQISKPFEDIQKRVPELSLANNAYGNRLWIAEHVGKRGVWSIGLEERNEQIVGYYINYKHRYSTAYDSGEARASRDSRLIPT